MTVKQPNGILNRISPIHTLAASVCLLLATSVIHGTDWPMWRCDSTASAVTSQRLADELHLQWTLRLPAQRTAWRDEQVMQFDAGYLPVVLGRKMFVASTVNDAVMAFDTRTGEEAWRYYTDGPIRVAPACWQDRVFAASDDGYLYCLSASTGKLLWRVRGGPVDRRIIGNGRIISTWPARGGPVVADGQVYFAAGIWPFMGTFIYALDAKTGRVVWNNDSTSFTFRRLPHYGSVAFSGLSPQGQLLAVGNRLIVPGSKLTPALLDRQSGRFLSGYAQGNGPRAFSQGRFGFAGGQIFDLETGDGVRLGGLGRVSHAVLAENAWYMSRGIYETGSINIRHIDAKEPHGDIPIKRFEGSIRKRSSLRVTPWLLADDRLAASRNSEVQLLDASETEKDPPVVWSTTVDGTPSHMLAADDRLFVVTREGEIYCFGSDPCEPKTHDLTRPREMVKPSRSAADEAKRLISVAGVRDGYCLVWGIRDGNLVDALARETRLHVVAVESDQRRVDALRRRLDAAGLYGTRAAVIHADSREIGFAPYMASLVTTEDPSAAIRYGLDFLFGKWGPIIRGDTIFPQVRRSMDLMTGERRMRTDSPGKGKEWKYQRSHGCGPMAGSQHLLTFRSACAGFLDTLHNGGTGNWGGFRSGCTSNLIAADGVLNAPDYTRTCGCGYQNRSSLALVHMPDVEYWTYGAIASPGRIGLNFGAPGDRCAPDGTLWVAWPNVPDRMARDKTLWWGHENAVDVDYVPRADVPTSPADATTYYYHSSRLSGDDGWSWVAASGLEGVRSIKVPLVDIATDKPFRVRLLFAEPTHEKPGQRVFDVAIDGQIVVSNLDLVRQTGGRWRTHVHEIPEVNYSGRKSGSTPVIEIELRARTGDPVISGVEIVQTDKP